MEHITNMSMIGFILCSLPVSYAMKRWSIRPFLILGSTFQFTATIIQYFAHDPDKFWLLAVGQVFAAAASATILQVPPRVSALWFPEHERATATAIGVSANVLGWGLGFIHSTSAVKWSGDGEMIQMVKGDLRMFFIVRCMITFGVFILTFAFEDTPLTPPHGGSPRAVVPLGESLSRLRGNVDFVLLSFSLGIYYGLYCTVSPLVDPVLTERYKSGYEWMIGLMSFISQMVSVGSFILVGRVVDKFPLHKLVSVILLLLSFILWLVFFIVLTNTDYFELLFLLYIFFGAVNLPMLALSMEHAAQMTYPITEETSASVLIILSNVMGLVLMYVIGYASQEGYVVVVGYGIAGLYLIASLMMAITWPIEPRRLNAEKL